MDTQRLCSPFRALRIQESTRISGITLCPTVKDTSIMDSLKKDQPKTAEPSSSLLYGTESAVRPCRLKKFRSQRIDSLSIAVLPSKIQPADAHFNAYATLQMCSTIEGSTVLLLGRDQLASYDGVDRKGTQIKGNAIVNYMLNLFLAKESLVQEIAELSRTFNVKLFSAVAVTAASYQVYGSIENMLNTALLKPLSTFDLTSSSLLYVLLRMPAHLKDKIPRVKIELAVTNWFKERTNPQSIHITEPVYTEDMSDRIDAILFIGGFDTTEMFADSERKVTVLKRKAVERGYITEDWQLPFNVEKEPRAPEIPTSVLPQKWRNQRRHKNSRTSQRNTNKADWHLREKVQIIAAAPVNMAKTKNPKDPPRQKG